MKIEVNRRKFLKFGAGTAGALVLTLTGSQSAAEVCGVTPPQTKGPFYPGEENFTEDHDLTRIPGHSIRASGQVIYVGGKVVGSDCRPLAGAIVEIWQACASGRYNNTKDNNTASLDPHFKYWGEATTDQFGNYLFKSILPGAYPADVDWMRPPHIHFKISKLGYKELITQLYFKGNPLNEADLILDKVPVDLRDSVVVEFKPASTDFEPGSLIGDFKITLQSVR